MERKGYGGNKMRGHAKGAKVHGGFKGSKGTKQTGSMKAKGGKSRSY